MGKNYDYGGREGGGGGWYKKSGKKNNKSEASPSYSAPTAGLSKVLFTFRTTKDAAAFMLTKSKLARHVGTQSWPGAAMASRVIDDMKDPDVDKPDRPVAKKEGQFWDSTDGKYKMEYEDYTEDMKEYRLWRGCWEENQPWMYNLVLLDWKPGSLPSRNGIRCK